MKISEFRIGKGCTSRRGDSEEWIKTHFEVTVKMPEQYTEEDLHEAVTRAEYFVDSVIGAPEVEAMPRLDIAEIEKLPWKKKVGEPAKPNGFGWLFGPGSRDGIEKGAVELVQAIRATKDGKLVLGDMEYSIVKDGAFVQRKPKKPS